MSVGAVLTRTHRLLMHRELPGPGPATILLRLFQQRNPLEIFTAMKEHYGDVVGFTVGSAPTVLVSNPAFIEQIIVGNQRVLHRDRITHELSRVLGAGLLTSEDEVWRRQRKMASPSLSRRQIAAYGDAMVHATQTELRRYRDGQIRDVHADAMRLTLDIVADTLLGGAGRGTAHRIAAPVEEIMLMFDRYANGWRRIIPPNVPTRGRRRLAEAKEVLDHTLHELIHDRRRGEPGNDLLWRLLEARDEDGHPMTAEQLRDSIATFYLAGHETTALTLAYTLRLLALHPRVMGQLCEEVDEVLGSRAATVDDLDRLPYLAAIIDESMRLYPPAWMIARENLEELTVGGYVLPAGTQIMCSQWVVHRDPRWFREPAHFVPERWLEGRLDDRPRFAYFPFGGGPRVCIGNHFSAMELRLMLATMVQRIQVHAVPQTEALDLVPTVTLRPRGAVKVKVTIRPRD